MEKLPPYNPFNQLPEPPQYRYSLIGPTKYQQFKEYIQARPEFRQISAKPLAFQDKLGNKVSIQYNGLTKLPHTEDPANFRLVSQYEINTTKGSQPVVVDALSFTNEQT